MVCVFLGGVDFFVVVVFVYKVIGKNFYCIFVDYGFLRKGEVDEVMSIFKD